MVLSKKFLMIFIQI